MNETKNEIIRQLKSTNREGMDEFIEWLEKTDFFTAPASTKYHLNHEGGLAEHSLSVFNALHHLDAYVKTKIPFDTIAITGLLHDICKIGIYERNPFNGDYNRDDPFPIGHGEKSVILMLNHGLKLTNKEMLMIRWHMAMYDKTYPRAQKYVKKYCPEAKLLYFADDISSTYLED